MSGLRRADVYLQAMTKFVEASAALAHAHSLLSILAVGDRSFSCLVSCPKKIGGQDNHLYLAKIDSMAKMSQLAADEVEIIVMREEEQDV